MVGLGGWSDAHAANPDFIELRNNASMHTPSSSSYVSAMVLAAGRGMRMRPLTDHTPKPLLQVHGQALIDGPLKGLLTAGVRNIVVNTEWLSEQIEAHCLLWAQSHPEVHLRLSHEGRDFGYALETAGGIVRALPRLSPVFWVTAADVYMPDFVFDPQVVQGFVASDCLAHVWLVPNPPHHPKGDFGWQAPSDARGVGVLLNDAPIGAPRYTFSTVGLYRRELFEAPWLPIIEGNPQGTAEPLGPLLRQAAQAGRVSASVYAGAWTDVGTPDRLHALNRTETTP
jgi:MurNAc alpha-1-phosphate uridylyltransferase